MITTTSDITSRLRDRDGLIAWVSSEVCRRPRARRKARRTRESAKETGRTHLAVLRSPGHPGLRYGYGFPEIHQVIPKPLHYLHYIDACHEKAAHLATIGHPSGPVIEWKNRLTVFEKSSVARRHIKGFAGPWRHSKHSTSLCGPPKTPQCPPDGSKCPTTINEFSISF